MKYLCTLFPLVLVLPLQVCFAESVVDSEVAWVLSYEQPKHECTRPKPKLSNEVAGKVARYQRKMQRFGKCVKKHQSILIEDHQRIVRAAISEITVAQANIFAGKLKQIEGTVTELGADVNVGLDPTEIDRIVRIGSRPSI